MRRFIWLRLMLVVVACSMLRFARTEAAEGDGETKESTDSIPASGLASEAIPVSTDYRISPSDIIHVDVFQERDLSSDFRVSQTGEITYPLLEVVKVIGLTPLEVEKLIRKRLIDEDFMVAPQVTVTVKDYRKRVVTVLGEVFKAGPVTLPAEQQMTVLEAIGEAGGFKPTAKDTIEVRRPSVDEPFRFKLGDLRKNTDPKKAFYLQPNDVIYVFERFL